METFPRYWPLVCVCVFGRGGGGGGGIHRSPVNSPHKGQRRGALMLSLICVWINDWVNNREAGDLRRYRAHYEVLVMLFIYGGMQKENAGSHSVFEHGMALQWRYHGCDSVSNHQLHDCLLNRLFRRRSKKTSKLRVTGLCAGNSPGICEFPAQMASYAEDVSIWWRHHGTKIYVQRF